MSRRTFPRVLEPPARGQERYFRSLQRKRVADHECQVCDSDCDSEDGADRSDSQAPLSYDEKRKHIIEGASKRKQMKQGVRKRVIGQARTVMATLALTVASSWNFMAAWETRQHGTMRPDVIEVFAERAEVSLRASRAGWFATQPYDIQSGCDLRSPEERAKLLQTIRKQRPRLVVLAFPCALWCQWQEMEIAKRGQEYRRKLRRLRGGEACFLQLVSDIFGIQKENGDDVLTENPETSRARKHRIIKEMVNAGGVYQTIGHQCMYGLKHIYTGERLRKATWWASTSPEIIRELSRRCDGRHGHDQVLGSRVSRAAGRYPRQLADAILRGLFKTLSRKEPARLVRLKRALERRVVALRSGAPESMVRLLEWCRNLKETVDCEILAAEAADDGMMPPMGISFDINPEQRKKAPAELLTALRKMHCNSGHPTNEDMRRCLKVSGASQLAQDIAKKLRCSTCARMSRPATIRPSRIPSVGTQFNEMVYVDLFVISDAKGRTFWFMLVIDQFTDFCAVQSVKSHKSEHSFKCLDRCWCSWAGPPDVIVADGERGFGSESMSTWLTLADTQLKPTATYSP